jgi:hypothetical protein
MSREKQIEEMEKLQDRLIKRSCTEYNTVTSMYLVEAAKAVGTLLEGYRKQRENTIELPCKVGDTVYRVKKRRGVWCILPREVVSLTYRLDYLYRVVWEIFTTETDILGKTVFLTEAEAEEALAKMKGGAE